jgi:hypothetical protein
MLLLIVDLVNMAELTGVVGTATVLKAAKKRPVEKKFKL